MLQKEAIAEMLVQNKASTFIDEGKFEVNVYEGSLPEENCKQFMFETFQVDSSIQNSTVSIVEKELRWLNQF